MNIKPYAIAFMLTLTTLCAHATSPEKDIKTLQRQYSQLVNIHNVFYFTSIIYRGVNPDNDAIPVLTSLRYTEINEEFSDFKKKLKALRQKGLSNEALASLKTLQEKQEIIYNTVDDINKLRQKALLFIQYIDKTYPEKSTENSKKATRLIKEMINSGELLYSLEDKQADRYTSFLKEFS